MAPVQRPAPAPGICTRDQSLSVRFPVTPPRRARTRIYEFMGDAAQVPQLRSSAAPTAWTARPEKALAKGLTPIAGEASRPRMARYLGRVRRPRSRLSSEPAMQQHAQIMYVAVKHSAMSHLSARGEWWVVVSSGWWWVVVGSPDEWWMVVGGGG